MVAIYLTLAGSKRPARRFQLLNSWSPPLATSNTSDRLALASIAAPLNYK